MTRLYERNELLFALVWIGAYVVLFSAADSLSLALGTEKLITAPLSLAMAVLLALWLLRSGLAGEYGLGRGRIKGSRYLYFLPLFLLASINLWNGAAVHSPALETALYVVSMLCVGFLEEVLFRGLLFRALCREGLGWALAVSSVSFGLGHIVNLLRGAQLGPTLLQIVYAAAIGFLFVTIFYLSGSLLPCILTHSAINALSAFAVERGEWGELAGAAVLTAVSLGYAGWLWRAEGGEGPAAGKKQT